MHSRPSSDFRLITSRRIRIGRGQLQKHREAMEQLAGEYRETRTAIEAFGSQRQVVTEAHDELQRFQADLRDALDRSGIIRRELDQLHNQASGLASDQAAIGRAAENVLANTAAATRSVQDIESKIASLGMLHELATTTEERLKSLNALAEHVAVKTKALDTQRVTIDHAASEASRLNEMVWAMEAQIGKLEEGNRQVARAEEVLRQAEKLAEEVQNELGNRSRPRHPTAGDAPERPAAERSGPRRAGTEARRARRREPRS